MQLPVTYLPSGGKTTQSGGIFEDIRGAVSGEKAKRMKALKQDHIDATCVSLSGCRNTQVAMETTAPGARRSTTAMTAIVMKILKTHQNVTYPMLLRKLLAELRHQHLKQIPQLSASHNFKVKSNVIF